MAPDAAAAAPPRGRRARPHAVRGPASLLLPGRGHDPRSLLRARPGADGAEGPARLHAGRPARRAGRPAACFTVSERHARRSRRALRAPRGEDRRDAERRRPRLLARETAGARDYVLARRRGRSRARTSWRRSRPPRRSGCRSSSPARRRTRRSPPSCGDAGARVCGATSSRSELVELYRGAACLVQASRYEGFGLPVLEAMACGTPVVTVAEPALREVVGDAAVVVEEDDLADGIRRALAEHDRLSAAGLERARAFSWRVTAEKTLDVYLEVLGRDRLRRRRLARARTRARAVAAGPAPAGRRARRRREPPRLGRGHPAGARVLENERPRTFAANVNRGVGGDRRRVRALREPDAIPEPGAVTTLAALHGRSTRAAASPARGCSGRTGRGSRRGAGFRPCSGTIVRRTPLRLLRPPFERQTAHYRSTSGRSRCRPTGCSAAPSCCCGARCSTRSAAGTPATATTSRTSTCRYRAARAGWERWYVPGAVVHHEYAAVIDKRFL